MQTNTSLASTLGALRDKYAGLLKPNLTAVMDGHIEHLRERFRQGSQERRRYHAFVRPGGPRRQ